MVYLLMAAAVCALDQLVKYWVVSTIELGGVFQIWPGVIHFTFVKNSGAAFSMLSEHTWLLTVISCVCIVVLTVLVLTKKVPVIEKIPLALVLGGAVGNAIDRIRLGYVVDMFEVEFTEYAVFNVADAFITCAGIFFCVVYLIGILREEQEKKRMRTGVMPELERLKRNIEAPAEQTGDETPDAAQDDGGESVDEGDTGGE